MRRVELVRRGLTRLIRIGTVVLKFTKTKFAKKYQYSLDVNES